MLAAATAALTAGAVTSTAGVAASLDVDGGVLQFFRLAGPGPVVVAPVLGGGGVAAATDVPEPLPPQVDGPTLAALAQPPGAPPAAPSPSTTQAAPTTQATPEPTVTPTEQAPTGAAATSSEVTPTPAAPSSPPAPEPSAAAPAAAPEPTTEPATPVYEDCAAFREVRDPELEPLTAEDPDYRDELDADGDGSACTDADLAAEADAAPDRQPPPAD